jgi:hypothetical protein
MRPLTLSSSMPTIRPCEVPQNSLLSRYQTALGFADCYVTEVPGAISQAAFIEAFYTSPLFKVERTILKYFVSKPATDADARQLADGVATRFSAWCVEGQSRSELLLADFSGRTRSWLMASQRGGPGRSSSTRLYFGSAVVPRQRTGTRQRAMGWRFHALLRFHRLYSRLLLRAASKRVQPA